MTTDLFGFLPFGILDVLDILLVAFLIYKLYELVRGTTAMRIFAGVVSIYVFWLIITALQMELLGQILRQFINVGVIALIIVFQQEIRRFLIMVGNSGFFTQKRGFWSWFGKGQRKSSTNLHALSEGVFKMAKNKAGALVVIERDANLQSTIDSGKKVNADMGAILLESLFFKNSPLHDGAVVVRGNRIMAASCMLPLSANRDLPASYGMCHRAGIGVTEESDAIAIIVSEETGTVSIAHRGAIEVMDDKINFRGRLHQLLTGD